MKRGLLLVVIAVALLPIGRLVARTVAGNGETVPRSSPARDELLSRAQVFLPLAFQPHSQPAFPAGDVVTCTYVPKPNHGTTPKFDCRTPEGVVLKVKYGDNPEIPADVAASQLLALLGFGAD